jgi:endonuclease YncB( thermonuclease family)
MMIIIRTVLLLALFLQGTAHAASIAGRVVGVMDGDTVEVLDAGKALHRIRLGGIDAPEKAQPFGQRSKEHLSSLVFGKQVLVETGKTDRYSRTIGKIIVNGVDANLSQINAGMAWHYRQYEKDQTPADRISYAGAEQQARKCEPVYGQTKAQCLLGNGVMEALNSYLLLTSPANARAAARANVLAQKAERIA